jgi:predicted MPP superfamily phosphohydrolase
MFLIVVLSVWILLHVYVFWRVGSIAVIQRSISRKRLIVIAVIACSSFILAAALEYRLPGLPASILQIIAENWIGVLFLIFVCLLAVDMATGFGCLFSRSVSNLRLLAVAAAFILSGIALVQGLRSPIVHTYEVEMRGLAFAYDGKVIVVVSDLHLGTQLGVHWLVERVDQINAERPHIVILAGDIVEGHGGNPSEFLPVLRRLSAPVGVWAVNGNHEGYHRATAPQTILEDAGFRLLRDRWAEIAPGLIIAGVDDLTTRRRSLGRDAEFVDRALAGRPEGVPTIFVSHTPWQPGRAAAQGVDLMISGHTHNGQIWPFTYIVRAVYPMVAGRYDIAGMPLIVCRGTGTWGPRMRLWSRSEILRIVLRAA